MEESSKDGDYNAFREKLLNAKSKDRRGKEGMGGRYAVYDVEYELANGEGSRSKITFISWTPDDMSIHVSELFLLVRGKMQRNAVMRCDGWMDERMNDWGGC